MIALLTAVAIINGEALARIKSSLMGNGAMKLTYYIENSAAPFSLHPLDVDRIQNSVVVEELVGTLLRTDRSHRRSTYLAKSWTSSPDNKDWVFHLEPGLSCEDGTSITPEHFVETFNWLLKLHLGKNENVPIFQDLVGWEAFKSGKVSRVKGIQAENGEMIRFTFSRPADVGFLAFLSIPQFGFYCRSNFTADGKWKQESAFVSSGPYKLNQLSSDRLRAELEIRADWPLHGESAPKIVSVHQLTDLANLENLKDPNIFVIRGTASDSALPSRYTAVEGAMTKLTALVVSPFMKNIFASDNNRRVFMRRFRDWQKQNPLTGTRFHPSDYFYADQTASYPVTDRSVDGYSLDLLPSKDLTLIYTTGIPAAILEHYVSGITYALTGSGLRLTVVELDRNDPYSTRKFLSNKDYDLRLVPVIVGGGFVNWMTEMMFCSDLGVCFPDASGRICSLAKEQKTSPISEYDYAARFNQILAEDAAVIPLHHSGSLWVFGSGISPDYISPVSPTPLFDQLRLK